LLARAKNTNVARQPMQTDPSKPLSDEEYEKLATFLDEFGALDIDELMGLFNALAVAPSLVQPSGWLPVVLPNGPLPSFDLDQTRALVDLLLRQYNEVITAFDEGEVIAPRADDEDTCIQFARGFVTGAELAPGWLDDEVYASLVAPFAYLCDRHDLIPPDELKELDENPNIRLELRSELGQLVSDAYDLIREKGIATASQPPIRREGPRIGRNDPCPCGSGKKFKKCCGVNQ
jgi:uncharacterized protein